MRISCIVAMSENFVIGRDNTLPWHLPADLKRFKALTMGHHLIMGRKTYDSIGRPLPGRTSVVLSRNPDFSPENVVVVDSFAAALQAVDGDSEAFVIGGESLYEAILPKANRLYLTYVHAEVDGDTYFPDRSLARWRLVEEETHPSDERNAYPYSFRLYEPTSE